MKGNGNRVYVNGLPLLVMMQLERKAARSSKDEPAGSSILEIQDDLETATGKRPQRQVIRSALRGLETRHDVRSASQPDTRPLEGKAAHGRRKEVSVFRLTRHGRKKLVWMLAAIDGLRVPG